MILVTINQLEFTTRLQLTAFDTITCNTGQGWPVALTVFYCYPGLHHYLIGMETTAIPGSG